MRWACPTSGGSCPAGRGGAGGARRGRSRRWSCLLLGEADLDAGEEGGEHGDEAGGHGEDDVAEQPLAADVGLVVGQRVELGFAQELRRPARAAVVEEHRLAVVLGQPEADRATTVEGGDRLPHLDRVTGGGLVGAGARVRSEEHTSELQSLMRISYAVFCLKKKNKTT